MAKLTAEQQKELNGLRAAYAAQLPERITALQQAAEEAMTLARPERSLDPGAIEKMFHLAHRLAGSSAIFGFKVVAEAAQRLETLLSSILESQAEASTDHRMEIIKLLETLKRAAQEPEGSGAGEGGSPPSADPGEAAGEPASPKRPETAESRAAGGANVLLVDDDRDTLDFVALHLRGARLSVETARNGNEALDKVRASPPDLIVADVKMEGMSGYELCRLLRTLGHVDIPFLFCSALGAPRERIMGLRMGADDYIVKPIDPEELLLKVRRQLEKSRKLRLLRKLAEERSSLGVMRGSLSEVPAPELLQMLAFLRVDEIGVRLEGPDGASGEVHVRDGKVIHAAAGELAGTKALLRMLAWEEGTFRVEREARGGEPTMSLPIQQFLVEGLEQLQECAALRSSLGLPSGCPLSIEYSPAFFTRRFEDRTAEMLSLIETYRDLDAVLDHSPLSDLESVRVIAELLQTGAIRVGRSRADAAGASMNGARAVPGSQGRRCANT